MRWERCRRTRRREKVLTQRSRLHPSRGCSEMQPPPPRWDIGSRGIQLRVAELLVQRAHDHRRQIPGNTTPPKGPAAAFPPSPARSRRRRRSLTGLSQRRSSRVPPPGRGLRPCGSPRTPSPAIRPRSPALGRASRGAPLPVRQETKLQRAGRASPRAAVEPHPPARSPSTHQAVQIGARRRRGPLFLGGHPPGPACLFPGSWSSTVTGLHRMRGPALLKHLGVGKDLSTAPARCINPSEIFTPMDSAASSKENGPWTFSANSRRPS